MVPLHSLLIYLLFLSYDVTASGFLPEKTLVPIAGPSMSTRSNYGWLATLVFTDIKNETLKTSVSVRPSDNVCGGAFITDNVIMTAAVCVLHENNSTKYTFVYVYAGKTDKYYTMETVANSVKVHEFFKIETLENNIAIIKLNKRKTSPGIVPVKVLEENDYIRKMLRNNPSGILVGIQRIADKSKYKFKNVLLQIYDIVIDQVQKNIYCRTQYDENTCTDKTSLMMIARWRENYNTPCATLSGTPVVQIFDDMTHALAGLISFVPASGCGAEDAYYGLSKASYYSGWINMAI